VRPRSKYPSIPHGCKTGLLLFGAAFAGENDGAHLLHAGLTCEVVDTDPSRLVEMEKHYPDTWTFTKRDAFEFAAQATPGSWDVVSVDPFTAEADRVYDMLDVWAGLARVMVVVGAQHETVQRRGIPRGWREVPRNGKWSWLVHVANKGVGYDPDAARDHRSPVGRGKKVDPSNAWHGQRLAQPSVVLAFNTPVYKRHDLTRACMKQRLACIEALPFRAVNIMVGDEPEHEAIAAETGSIFVHHGNNEPALGAKFNAGYAAAREAGATHVMAIGSDSWIAPQALADLPYCTDWVTSLTALSAFKEDGTERFDLSIRYAAGFGVAMIYPIGALGPEPCDPAKPKGCDGSARATSTSSGRRSARTSTSRARTCKSRRTRRSRCIGARRSSNRGRSTCSATSGRSMATTSWT
jgi:hypothetical protein